MSVVQGNGISVGSFCTADDERFVLVTTGASSAIVNSEAARLLATQLTVWADFAERMNANPKVFRAAYEVKWTKVDDPSSETEGQHVKEEK